MRKSTWKETYQYWKYLNSHKVYPINLRIKDKFKAIKFTLHYKNLNHATDPSELPFE